MERTTHDVGDQGGSFPPTGENEGVVFRSGGVADVAAAHVFTDEDGAIEAGQGGEFDGVGFVPD